MSLHIELIGSRVHVKSEDLNVVLTASELIELTQWGIDHEVELRSKVWQSDIVVDPQAYQE